MATERPEMDLDKTREEHKKFLKIQEKKETEFTSRKENAFKFLEEIAKAGKNIYDARKDLEEMKETKSPVIGKLENFIEKGVNWIEEERKNNPDVNLFCFRPEGEAREKIMAEIDERLTKEEKERVMGEAEEKSYQEFLKRINTAEHFGHLGNNIEAALKKDYVREAEQGEIENVEDKIKERKDDLDKEKSPDRIEELKRKIGNYRTLFLRFKGKIYCRKGFIKPSAYGETIKKAGGEIKQTPEEKKQTDRELEVFTALGKSQVRAMKNWDKEIEEEGKLLAETTEGMTVEKLLNPKVTEGKLSLKVFFIKERENRKELYRGVILLEKKDDVIKVADVKGKIGQIVEKDLEYLADSLPYPLDKILEEKLELEKEKLEKDKKTKEAPEEEKEGKVVEEAPEKKEEEEKEEEEKKEEEVSEEKTKIKRERKIKKDKKLKKMMRRDRREEELTT